MTSKIQGKIMHEDKGPSINLKNINYINKVEYYNQKPGTSWSQRSMIQDTKPHFSARGMDETKSIFEQDYFTNHIYMLRDKLLEMFKNSETIPAEDKKTIEKEFHKELKELKKSLHEIKEVCQKLLAENHERHLEIDAISEEILVTFFG